MLVSPYLRFRLMLVVTSIALVHIMGCDTNDAVSSEPLNTTPPLSMGEDITDGPNTEESLVDEPVEREADMNEDETPLPESSDGGSSALTFMPLSDAGDVVSFVDVERYMGVWYEIATTPSFQQRSCSNTQASYEFNEEEGWVDVVNTCYVGGPEGRPQRIQGRAELVDLDTQAKLSVIFFGQRAPYWVVALDGTEADEPYQWAVVSVPGGQTMWILSRTPTITDAIRSEINLHLQERGFAIDRLIDTPQTN